jgi:hypothetical protein
MLAISSLAIVMILAIIVYQDFKFRAVSWILFPLLAAIILLENIFIHALPVFADFYLINFGFIAVQLVLITLYFSLRNKRWVKLWEQHLGAGDILFFLILCLFFSPVNFLLFYLGSLIVTVVVVLVLRRVRTDMNVIPLAGIQSGLLAVLIVASLFTNTLEFKNDPRLIIPLFDGRA